MSEVCCGNCRHGVSRELMDFLGQKPHVDLPEHSKLVTLMALGYRLEAISILVREVMQPRGKAQGKHW